MRPYLLILPCLCAATAMGQSPVERYEVGRRTHEFEVVWDAKIDNTAARERAAPIVDKAVQNFFRLNFSGAAKSLDDARHALLSVDPAPPAVRWAETINILVESRLIDTSATEIAVIAKQFYKPDGKAPPRVSIRVHLGAAKSVEVPLVTYPAMVKVPTRDAGPASADLTLTAEIVSDSIILATRTVQISRVEKLTSRLSALKKAAAAVPAHATSTEQQTLVHLSKLLNDLANATIPETDYPAARLVVEAEALARAPTPYYTATRSGDFWLSLPTAKTSSVVRVRVPENLDVKKPVPVVVALHGMGGSENMYFDGYGNGVIPRQAKEHGWLFVAPRATGLLGAGPAPSVPAILDELAKQYPIDPKKVFLVGHSMGAGHAIALVQQSPERFAAVAALGGGGRVGKAPGLDGMPFFVGCGKLDFALKGAKSLHQSLDKIGATVTFKEFDNIEHLTIVRAAADDVFAFFDAIKK